MFEKGAAIRKQRRLEADAWMEVNRGRIGIPSEIEGVKATGKLHHDLMGDGWDNLPWRFQGDVRYTHLNKKGVWTNGGKDRLSAERRSTFNKALKRRKVYDKPGQLASCISVLYPLGRYSGKFAAGPKVKPDVSMKPTMERGYFPTSIFDGFKQVAERNGYGLRFADEDWRLGSHSKRQALGEISRGGLKKKTVVLGEQVPSFLLINKEESWSERQLRNRRVCHFGDLFTEAQLDGMNPEDMFEDKKQLELIAVNELWDLLRSQGLTDKETEALDCRANDLAVRDRHCLSRAQKRARSILAGKIVIKAWRRPVIESVYEAACWTTV